MADMFSKQGKANSLFGNPKKENPQPVPLINSELSSINGRLRVLEERFSNLRNKNQLLDNNILSNNRRTNSEIKNINSELTTIRNEISNIKRIIEQFISELKKSAKSEDLNVLKKYLDIWEPMSFITRKEFEETINELRDKKI